jgi:photosystem II reaction center protein PsbP
MLQEKRTSSFTHTSLTFIVIMSLTCAAATLLFLNFALPEQQIIKAQLPSNNVSLSEYSNPYYGFEIEYPSDWTYTESEIPPNATIYSVLNIVPPISDDPNLSTNLQIGIEDLEIGQLPSLDQYVRDTINAYRGSYSNFTLESARSNSTISGMPAYEIVFTYSSDDTNRKSIETGLIDETNNRAYYLFFETAISTYDQFYPFARDIFDSFQLVDVSSSLDEDINGITEDESTSAFPGEDSTQDFSPFEMEDSEMTGMQDFELLMNSFADSIFNGSSTFGAIGTSMIEDIKISGITIVEGNDTGRNSLSGNNVHDNETDDLTVNLISSDIDRNDSVTIIAARIPFSIQDILSLASMNEENPLSNEMTPFAEEGLSQEFNPFESLSNLQIGSTNLVSPDWSSPQSVNMSLVGGGVKTNNHLSQMENDSLDLVFVSVVPYTGN